MNSDPFDTHSPTPPPATTPAANDQPIQNLDGTDQALDASVFPQTVEQAAEADEGSHSADSTNKQQELNSNKTVTNKSGKTSTKQSTKSKSSSKTKSSTTPAAESIKELTPPTQTIEQAIIAGFSPRQLDELFKEWSKYNEQQALRRVKDENAALAAAIGDRRRKIADQLLKFADDLGLTMAEAKRMLTTQKASDGAGKSK